MKTINTNIRRSLLGLSLLLTLIAPIPISAAGSSAPLFQDGWTQINESGFGDAENSAVRSLEGFRGELFAGTMNESGSGAQLWGMDRSGNWSNISSDGLGDSDNTVVADLIKFRDHLYAGTNNSIDGGGVYRSADGSDWNQVVLPGFNPSIEEITHFAEYKGHIYASTWDLDGSHGTEIWRSPSRDSGDWTQVVSNGFDEDPGNQAVVTFEEFKGTLFAGTDNWSGLEIWSSTDGTTWTQVSTSGFGDLSNLSVTLEAYKGHLYAATYNWILSADPGFELWRCKICDGSDWQELPIEKGLGETENRAFRALVTSSGLLYGVTYNRVTGIQVWSSPDGLEWSQLIGDGFGDPANLLVFWDTSVAVVRDSVHIGTLNQDVGCEVWRQGH